MPVGGWAWCLTSKPEPNEDEQDGFHTKHQNTNWDYGMPPKEGRVSV
jgi:hypothetical protein